MSCRGRVTDAGLGEIGTAGRLDATWLMGHSFQSGFVCIVEIVAETDVRRCGVFPDGWPVGSVGGESRKGFITLDHAADIRNRAAFDRRCPAVVRTEADGRCSMTPKKKTSPIRLAQSPESGLDPSPALEVGEAGRYAYEGLDRTIHEKARLGILTSLAANPGGLLFGDLKDLCSLTDGNLSRHLQTLHDAGLVEVWKRFQLKRPQTLLRLTDLGRQKLLSYISELERVVADAAAARRLAQASTSGHQEFPLGTSGLLPGWTPG